MKKSIKWKVTIIFNIVIICCIGSILLFNTIFLEKFYILEKKIVLTNTYKALNDGIMESYKNGYVLDDLFRNNNIKNHNNIDYSSGENNFILFLNELQKNYNVNIILVDKNNKVYSLYFNSARFGKRILNYIFKDAENDENIQILEKKENYSICINNKSASSFDVINNSNGPSEYYENPGPGAIEKKPKMPKRNNIFMPLNRYADIECFGFLEDNETAFFMVIPVSSIKEPLSIFNRVLVILSIFVLIVGSIFVFIISNNITLPLLELAEISRKMSRLEFENKYEIKSQDEIAVLGNSMNEMSNKLEKTIKELKNANVKLKKDIEKKEQLDLMRQEFVANVSHELKTPIALIEGYAEGLETDGIADNKEQRQYYIDVIKDEANKMNNMVRNLLDLSALERGMADLEITRINLYDAINGLIKSQELAIKEINANVKVQVDKNCYVWADGFKLEEIIRNYFTNALHYVDSNKLIVFYIKKISDEKIRLFVYNSGMVLSEEEQSKIWEKFYKVDKAHSRAYGGTGLGLSIVKAIAEQHNTTCGCEAVINSDCFNDGMQFYFDFSIN